MKTPNSADLLGRLLEMASALPLLVADGARASADARDREQRQLIDTKNGFVRMTAHELRRPIGVLNGYLSMLQDGTCGELPERVRTAVERISDGTQEMAKLVDGLITIAQLEDRDDALRLAAYPLGPIVAEAVAVVEAEGAAKRISIQRNIFSPDAEIDVDADRLRIAIVNLLSNAIKYGSEGTTVTVATHQEADRAMVTVTIRGREWTQLRQTPCSKRGSAGQEPQSLVLGSDSISCARSWTCTRAGWGCAARRVKAPHSPSRFPAATRFVPDGRPRDGGRR